MAQAGTQGGTKLRIGIIGCGGNMSGHVKRLVEQHGDEVEVAALVDPSEASIERLVERNPSVAQAPRFKDHAEMLSQVKPDAVEISTPHTLHFQHIMDSLEAGAHVLTEKPMALSLADCDRMIAAAERAGRHLTVIHNRRFDSAARAMKELVDSGDLSEPFLVETHGIEGPNTVGRGRWLASRTEGGIAMAQTVHFAYMVHWLLGPVTEVTCFTSRKGIDWMQGEVSCIILLRFAGDAIGEMTSTFAAAAGKNEHRITIYGDRGIVSHVRDELRVVCPARYGDDEWHTIRAGEGDWGEGFRHQIVQFGRAIAGQGEVAVPPAEGRAAVEIIAAAYRSAAERRAIPLPLTEY